VLPMLMRTTSAVNPLSLRYWSMAKQVVDLALDLRDASTSASSTSIDMG